MSWLRHRVRLQVQFAIGREERTERSIQYSVQYATSHVHVHGSARYPWKIWCVSCECTLRHHSTNTLTPLCFQPVAGEAARNQARATMDRIGNQLLKDSKIALAKTDGEKDERFKKRDLLSLLLKANLSTDIPENQRMNDRDVLARKFHYLLRSG